MNRRYILIALAAAVLGVGAAAPSRGQTQTQPAAAAAPAWDAEGVMADACQCEVFCPCEFLSTPSHGHCDDAAILIFSKGHYKETDLAGLRVAVVSASREGKRIVDTVGDLAYARIFVPQEATEAQSDALAQVARNVFGAFVGTESRVSPDEKVVRAPIEVKAGAHRFQVRIAGVLEVDIEGITGGDGANPIVVRNNAFAAFGAGDIEVAKTNVYRYTRDGLSWDYPGRSASIRSFKMHG